MLFSSHLSAQQLFFNEHVSHKGFLLSSDDISADFAAISDWWTPPICIIRMKARPLKSGFSLLLEKPRKQSVRIQGLWRQKGKFWENIWWKLLHAGLKSCKLFLTTTSIKRINRLFLCFFSKKWSLWCRRGWSLIRSCVSIMCVSDIKRLWKPSKWAFLFSYHLFPHKCLRGLQKPDSCFSWTIAASPLTFSEARTSFGSRFPWGIKLQFCWISPS